MYWLLDGTVPEDVQMASKRMIHLKEQGLEMHCLYCKVIYPDLDSPNCPICHGTSTFFQPARMMDEATSQITLLRELAEFFAFSSEKTIRFSDPSFNEIGQNTQKELKERVFDLLKKVEIYQFDLRQTLINMYQQLDQK